MDNKTKILAVVGPTASGKTGLSVELAKMFSGEIISCDSMQVYKGLDVGTAKVTQDEMQGIPHHLIDFLEIGEEFSVSEYVDIARVKIDEITARGNVPIIVGGTGLYIRSLIYGVNFTDNSRDEALRLELEERIRQGKIEELYKELKDLDEVAAQNIHINNHVRVIRALEYCKLTGEKFSMQSLIKDAKYDFLMFYLEYKNREILYDRINRRVDIMMESGLLEEAKHFFEKEKKTAAAAIGYKELFPYIKGEITIEEAVENIKRESRRYAKRQITWFKAEKNTTSLMVDSFENSEALLKTAIDYTEKFL